MTLQMIFKDNPDLLKTKEVGELIEYCELRHQQVSDLVKEYKDFHDLVLEYFVHSELVLKKGVSAKETLKKIGDKLENI